METNSILTFSCLSTLEQYIESQQTQKIRFHGASLHLGSISAETIASNIDRIGLLKEYLQLAYHSCGCFASCCSVRKCSRMKSLIEHYKSCDFTFHCQYYRSFYCLVVIHARECKELEYCRMPTCKAIRLSLQEKYIKQVIDNNLFLLNYEAFFEKWSQGTQTAAPGEEAGGCKRKHDAIEDANDEKAAAPAECACSSGGGLYEMDHELIKSRQEMTCKRANLVLKLKKWHNEHPNSALPPSIASNPFDRRNYARVKLFPSVKTLVFQTIFERLNMNSQKLFKELYFAKLTVRIMRKELEINRRVTSLTEYSNLISEFIYENQKRIKSLRKTNPLPTSKVFADASTQTDSDESAPLTLEPSQSNKRLKLQ